MKKALEQLTNDFCPQALFLYGTYKSDGAPDFGLFCWFSYIFDGELGAMACIGGEKLTKELILKNRVFSANLVTQPLLPAADFLGNTDGHAPEKAAFIREHVKAAPGLKLKVPVLEASPISYELEVARDVPLDDGLLLLCKIRCVQAEEALLNPALSVSERMSIAAPAITTCQTYFAVSPAALGGWGAMMPKA